MSRTLALLVISLICLAGCSKTAAPGSTKIITPAGGIGDTVTIIDNGVTYSYSNTIFIDNIVIGVVGCSLEKTSSSSAIGLQVNPNVVSATDTEIYIRISAPGPLNSIGAYRVTPLDSFSTTVQFIEAIGTSEKEYRVDSVVVNVFYAGGTTVIGNYEMWVSAPRNSKSVTGNFNFHNARIE